MGQKQYYSVRSGKHTGSIALPQLKILFEDLYSNELLYEGYLQEKLGSCEKWEPNSNINCPALFLKKLQRDNLWPIVYFLESYTEDDLFDVIEFLYDLVSKPKGDSLFCCDCKAFHYERETTKYSKQRGKDFFRLKINELLRLYDGGFELTEEGEIVKIENSNITRIFEATLPIDDKTSQEKLEHALKQMQRRHNTHSERKEAVRLLGDILEPIRQEIISYCRDDEKDLFLILNKFGHRHHRPNQKTQYDSKIFDTWLFYHYLAAVHAYSRIFERAKLEKTYTES